MAIKLLNNFLIGCDPEFLGLDSEGKLVNFKNRLPKDGEIGFDHNGWAGEFRPEPAQGTYAILKRLQKLVFKLPAFRGVNKLRGGAYHETTRQVRAGEEIIEVAVGPNETIEQTDRETRQRISLGGHVHFNLPPGHIHVLEGTNLTPPDYFTRYVEALDILPRDESNRRRSATEYGRLGDFRYPDHLRTEYRSMASWMYHPANAFLCLTGAKLSVCDPEGTRDALAHPERASYMMLKKWFEQYKRHDTNARRICETLLERGHQDLIAQPDLDIRESWKELPC